MAVGALYQTTLYCSHYVVVKPVFCFFQFLERDENINSFTIFVSWDEVDDCGPSI